MEPGTRTLRRGAARRTKIVATIGPSSGDEAMLRRLMVAGMNVARINFSHASHKQASETAARIRHLAEELGCVVALLADLQGPRLRIGPVAGGEASVQAGNEITLTTRPVPGDSREIMVEYAELPREVRVGDSILIDDGRVQLRVNSLTATDVGCLVTVGGTLRPFKGINLPGVSISAPSLTDKDRRDLAFCLENDFDYIALSFVRSAADVDLLKSLIDAAGATTPVIAKIEKHEAIDCLDEIFQAADGVMVARGDLGVEMPTEEVPILQKRMIASSRALGKPVITATQMLESMVANPRPTRAEASDVANAIFDGTDAVMLSGETASGQYPVEAVETMARIAATAEAAESFGSGLRLPRHEPETITGAVTRATVEIAQTLEARAILTLTESGLTARLVAQHRVRVPILGVTPNPHVLRRLALVWGVQPLLGNPSESTDGAIANGLSVARASGHLERGDRVVITSGAPPRIAGRTNMVRVHVVGEDD